SPMRAVVVDKFGPPEALRVRETSAPIPGPGQVLVETHAAPVNYVDILIVGGTYQFVPRRPFVPGKGPAGIVVALGPEVTDTRHLAERIRGTRGGCEMAQRRAGTAGTPGASCPDL